MKYIDKYILAELAGPFLFGVAAFTSIMIGSNLLFQLARYIVELNMPIQLAGRLFLLELPGIIVLTFPMSTLLATLLAFGRLSGNSEIIAFKASGVSFQRMMIPVLLVGLLTSFVTIYVNEEVVPFTKFENRRLYYEFVYGERLPTTQSHLTMNPIDKDEGLADYLLYARYFNGEEKSLSNVYYIDIEGGRIVSQITAREAKWIDSRWIFYDGMTRYYPGPNEPPVEGEFKEYVMKDVTRSPQQITLSTKQKRLEELTAGELRQVIEDRASEGKDNAKVLVTYHQRFAIPFSCLIFALIGAPLGLRPNRSGSSIGLGLSIIIIFIYYVIMTVFGAVGQAGAVPPVIAAWLPNILFGGIGLAVIYQKSR